MELVLLLLACSGDPNTDGGDNGATDTGDTGENGGDSGPQPAPLAELSSGECPDLSASGTSTFVSNGVERQVTIILPETLGEAMPVSFFFHGIDDPTRTSNPGGETANSLGLQAIANETQTIWVVPDAPVMNLYNIYEVYLWDLALDGDDDLVLFDDLRTCIAQSFDVDLRRVAAVGFSGGALFTTVVAVNRADTLSTAVEMSGGSDLEIPGWENLWSAYVPPAQPLPMLLSTGGNNDVWPSTSLVIVDFSAASDTLQGELLGDASFVARCEDSRGHTMTGPEWSMVQDWVSVHRYGEPSPYAESGMGADSDWCTIPTAE